MFHMPMSSPMITTMLGFGWADADPTARVSAATAASNKPPAFMTCRIDCLLVCGFRSWLEYEDALHHLGFERLDGHAGERGGGDLEEIVHRELGDRLAVTRHHGLERLDVRQLGLRLDHRGHAVEAVDHLRVHPDARPTACRPGRRWRCAWPAARTSGCSAWWSPARTPRLPSWPVRHSRTAVG